MRPCHICQKIIRIQKSLSCSTCTRVLCLLCVSKYFPQKIDTLPKFKFPKCFVCNNECKCFKCNSAQNVVINNSNVIQPQDSSVANTLVNEDEPITQVGLFRGKKISELPLYLQRIYLKKKVLYSMHQISSPNDKNIQIQNNQQAQRQNLTEQEKAMKQIDQSVMPQEQQIKQSEINDKNEQNQNQEEEEQQADDYESQFASKRAAHVHHNQNSAIDQQAGQDQNNNNVQVQEQQIVDQNEQSERKRRQQIVEQALLKRNNQSQEVQEINEE